VKTSAPDASATVLEWRRRAAGYARLTARYALFADLADRLIDFLSPQFSGVAFDIAAGTGTVSRRLLRRCAAARVVLIEPADEMLARARLAVGARALADFALRAEECGDVPFAADVALCGAALHLMDEAAALRAVSGRLVCGGVFACNLWWHSFAETSDRTPRFSWREPVAVALREAGLPVPVWPAPPEPRQRTRAGLAAAAAAAGLSLDRVVIDEDIVPAAFFIDFAAMSPQWLGDVPPPARERIRRRAVALAPSMVPVSTVRLYFSKI
jgi:SAM-dependent methyltransferase